MKQFLYNINAGCMQNHDVKWNGFMNGYNRLFWRPVYSTDIDLYCALYSGIAWFGKMTNYNWLK